MSITLTQRQLITDALLTLQVLAPGEAPDAAEIQTGQRRLAELIDNWNTQDLTVLVVNGTSYDLVANQQTYTIGPGGDFDTGTAARPMSIEAANLVLNSSTPPTWIPLAMLTDAMYQQLAVPTQTNGLPTALYYNASDPLGTILLWPIPTDGSNDLELFTSYLTPQFADLSSSYICPPGYAKAFRYGLAESMIDDFAIPDTRAGRLRMLAAQALTDLKMTNVKMADLAVDTAFAPDPRGLYNILSDTGA